jgi:excinuclease ABC subunit C
MKDTGEEVFEKLKAVAANAPQAPGCYLMRDESGEIIYVGKAKILRNRLRSYFAGKKDIKTTTLLKHARSIETIIVSSEYEALLLENTLIKEHFPHYNIDLKDGKTYPVVRVTNEDFPRVFKTRYVVNDGSLYFGPFPKVLSLDALLAIAEKFLPLRKCKVFHRRANPCLYYHIGRCSGPCAGKIDKAAYAAYLDKMKQLLAGKTDALVAEITKRMNEAATALDYERAATLRDEAANIRALVENANSVVDFVPESRDYIAWAGRGVLTTFSVFSMRYGKLTGRDLFRARSAASEEESFETFVSSYYNSERKPPAKIYIRSGQGTGFRVQDEEASWQHLRRWFNETFGYAPDLVAVNEADQSQHSHNAVLGLARQNALEDLRRRVKERGAGAVLEELARELGLRRRPVRIEGFDIAQLDGKHTVASLVSFKNGVPDKKNYRRFKLRTTEGIVDDFQSMREVVRRRYSRLVKEGTELPDLILVDGGIGQVNATKGVLDALGLDIPLAGLAKRDEEIWLPGASTPLCLSKRDEGLKILQFVRDETHRFATTFNQNLRSKDLSLPALEAVRGIGPAKAAALLRAYGGLRQIAAAAPADIAARAGVSEEAALDLRANAALALDKEAREKKRLESSRTRANLYGKEDNIEELALLAAEDEGGKYGES